MTELGRTKQCRRRTLTKGMAALSFGILLGSIPATAHAQRQDRHRQFWPGNLVVSRSVYDNNPNNVKVGQILPPNCASTLGGCSASTGATNNGIYPYVWNNAAYDGSFGITSKIYLDQITPFGWLINSLEVPNSQQPGRKPTRNRMVGSFSSKSELALHLSTDGRYLTFMGYVAPVNTLDVSNSNTPGVVDPTNPVGEAYYRAVAQVDRNGRFQFTETNAYSGNNGRAAVLSNSNGVGNYYISGNAGHGSKPQPLGILVGAGAQILDPSWEPEREQDPGTPTPIGSFSVTELGYPAEPKIGKDNNFRGITVFHNVVYYTKGSGGNGVNTVYFIDTTGTACPKGTGLPAKDAKLPTTPLSYDSATLQTSGLPNNMCILAGFPTVSAKTGTPLNFPFGIWFANAKTLYVADEGDGYTGGPDLYTHAAAQTMAGLEKWVFNSTTNTWNLVYTLQTGLNLGQAYTVNRYPTGNNTATNLPWAPAADGLRNMVGVIASDKVIVWATTSTVSGNGDTGADPNRLVAIIDDLNNTSPSVASAESFYTIRSARFGEALRGVSFTPGTDFDDMGR